MLAIALLVFYFIGIFYLSITSGQKENADAFLLGNRDVGLLSTMNSVTSGFRDSSGLAFWMGFALLSGYGCAWALVGLCAGMILISLVGVKIRETAKANNYITVNEVVRDQLGSYSEKLSALPMLFMGLTGAAMQLYVIGNMFGYAYNIPSWISIPLIASVIGIYLYLGGYYTVVKTDVLQLFVILFVLIIPFSLPIAKEDILNFGSFFSLSFLDTIGIFLLSFLFTIADGSTWQRVFSAKNSRVIKTAFPLSAVVACIVTIPLIWIAFGLKPYLDQIEGKEVIFAILEVPQIPSYASACFCVVLTSMAMSTIDTLLYTFSSTLIKNFLPERFSKDSMSYIKSTRKLIVPLIVALTIIAILMTDLLQFFFNALSFFYIIAPVQLFSLLGWFSKTSKEDKIVSSGLIISGIAYFSLSTMGIFDKNLILISVPSFISLLFCIIAVAMQKCQHQSREVYAK